MTKGRNLVLLAACVVLFNVLATDLGAQLASPSLFTNGQASVEWQLSDQPDSSALLAPPNFIQARLSNTFTVLDVPIQLSGFWTTAQSPLRQNMNYIRLSFEAGAIQSLGDQLLQKRIRAIEDSIQQLESISKQTNPLSTEKDKLFSKHTSIQSQFERSGLSDQEARLFKSDLKSLKHQEAKMAVYHRKLMQLRKKKGVPGSRKYERFVRYRDSLISLEHKRQNQSSKLQKQLNFKNNAEAALPNQEQRAVHSSSIDDKNDQRIAILREQLAQLKAISNSSPDERMRYVSDSAPFFKKALRLAQRVERFQIGTSFPTYSKLSLNGVPIFGVDVAITPRKFYVAGSGGQSQRQIQPLNAFQQPTQRFDALPDRSSIFQQNSFNRRLYATQFGYGRRDSNFVYGHVLYGVDRASTVSFDSLQTGLRVNRPEQNVVFGCSFAQRVLDGPTRLKVYGEFNKSIWSINRIESPLEGAQIAELANHLRFQQGNRSSDFAGLIGLSGSIDSLSTFDVQLLRVNPFYKSMGLLFMRSDFQTVRLSVNRKLWRKQLMAQVFLLDDRTNLYLNQSNGANSIGAGGEIGLTLANLPNIAVGYQKMLQNDQQHQVTDSTSQAGFLEQSNLRIQYGIPVGSIQLVLQSTGQIMTRSGVNPKLNHSLRIWNTQVLATLPIGLQWQIGYQLIDQKHILFEQRIQGAEIGLNYLLFERWQQGISYRFDKAYTNDSRQIISYMSQILVNKWLQFQVQLAVNQLEMQEQAHQWKFIQAGIKINW